MKELYYSSISTLSNRIREQRVSPVAIVHACLQRIEELNPKINAFITVLTNEALTQAKEAEAEVESGHWRGPLHGIPVGIKDFYDTAGWPTCHVMYPCSDCEEILPAILWVKHTCSNPDCTFARTVTEGHRVAR